MKYMKVEKSISSKLNCPVNRSVIASAGHLIKWPALAMIKYHY